MHARRFRFTRTSQTSISALGNPSASTSGTPPNPGGAAPPGPGEVRKSLMTAASVSRTSRSLMSCPVLVTQEGVGYFVPDAASSLRPPHPKDALRLCHSFLHEHNHPPIYLLQLGSHVIRHFTCGEYYDASETAENFVIGTVPAITPRGKSRQPLSLNRMYSASIK